MTWFDYFALGIFIYFVIRGFFSGFMKTFFSLMGMVVAYFYSGILSLKIMPVIKGIVPLKDPKMLSVIGFVIAFILIYLTFVVVGFFISAILKKLHLGSIDQLAGALFGFVKALLFVTFVYLAIVLAIPSQKDVLTRSLCYPLIKQSLKISTRFVSDAWKNFIEKYAR